MKWEKFVTLGRDIIATGSILLKGETDYLHKDIERVDLLRNNINESGNQKYFTISLEGAIFIGKTLEKFPSSDLYGAVGGDVLDTLSDEITEVTQMAISTFLVPIPDTLTELGVSNIIERITNSSQISYEELVELKVKYNECLNDLRRLE